MTIKSVQGWGSATTTEKSSEKFSVTLTVPFQIEIEADDCLAARRKATTLPISDVERIAVERGRVKCPTLGASTYEIKRTILATEKIDDRG